MSLMKKMTRLIQQDMRMKRKASSVEDWCNDNYFMTSYVDSQKLTKKIEEETGISIDKVSFYGNHKSVGILIEVGLDYIKKILPEKYQDMLMGFPVYTKLIFDCLDGTNPSVLIQTDIYGKEYENEFRPVAEVIENKISENNIEEEVKKAIVEELDRQYKLYSKND
jgi:hypothetical protein